MTTESRVSAIINCAGKGTRFGSNKLLAMIGGRTVLERTLSHFDHPLIDDVVVTVSKEHAATYRAILDESIDFPITYVIGGSERHVSAKNGLDATTGDLVLVHDGVRPFLTADLIDRVIAAAREHDAAMLALPATVQVKLVSEDGFAEASLDRSRSWLGQTPHVFRRRLLEAAYNGAIRDHYERTSDDADLVAEYCGVRAKVVEGHPNNLKITTPQDQGTANFIADELRRMDER